MKRRLVLLERHLADAGYHTDRLEWDGTARFVALAILEPRQDGNRCATGRERAGDSLVGTGAAEESDLSAEGPSEKTGLRVELEPHGQFALVNEDVPLGERQLSAGGLAGIGEETATDERGRLAGLGTKIRDPDVLHARGRSARSARCRSNPD